MAKLENRKLVPAMIRSLLAAGLLAAAAAASRAATHEEFEAGIKSVLAPAAGKSVRALKVFYLAADIGPWMDTGLALAPGDRVTLVLEGALWWSKAQDIRINPAIVTWVRIGGEGPIFRNTRRTSTVTAQKAGTLQFKPLPAGRWLDETGRYTGDPAPANPDWGGGVSVAAIQWAPGSDPAALLKTLGGADGPPDWAQEEIARLASGPVPAPAGWHYMLDVGRSEIFRELTETSPANGPRRRIGLFMRDDAAILQREFPADLTPGTRLSWTWKAVKLPASLSENTFATHDYMSFAVEFDNGQDLSYIWSRNLPAGMFFRCPIPNWHDRETHFVVRTGETDLGRWVRDERNVFEDYKTAIGGEMPKRIVRIWLIAVSLFRHGEGRAEFADMTLLQGRTAAPVPIWPAP